MRLDANQFGARTSPRTPGKINSAVARLTRLHRFGDLYPGPHRNASSFGRPSSSRGCTSIVNISDKPDKHRHRHRRIPSQTVTRHWVWHGHLSIRRGVHPRYTDEPGHHKTQSRQWSDKRLTPWPHTPVVIQSITPLPTTMSIHHDLDIGPSRQRYRSITTTISGHHDLDIDPR